VEGAQRQAAALEARAREQPRGLHVDLQAGSVWSPRAQRTSWLHLQLYCCGRSLCETYII
jgi:hypothetical protein